MRNLHLREYRACDGWLILGHPDGDCTGCDQCPLTTGHRCHVTGQVRPCEPVSHR